jgi:uncharacterized membrane protein
MKTRLLISSLMLCSMQTIYASTTIDEVPAKLDELAKSVGNIAKTVTETKQMAHSAATVSALGWIIPTVIVVLLAIGWSVFFRKSGSRSQAAQPEVVNDPFFRSQLARVLTTYALLFFIIFAALVLACAGINASLNPSEKATQLFFDIARYLLGVLLPVIAGWVGTVLAFYFGKDNFETATKSFQALTSQQKLASTPVGKLGLLVPGLPSALTLETNDPSKAESEKNLDEIKAAFSKGNTEEKPFERLPVLLKSQVPYMVLHRSLLNDFLLKAPKGPNPKDSTLADLFTGTRWQPAQTFVTVDMKATAASAKAEMEKKTGCSDVFVTTDGTAKGQAIRWITNVDLLTASQI